MRALLVFSLFHLHLHHRFHGPPFDYVGLAIGAAISSAGFPGPGESLLIAASILAAANKLDFASVVAVAFLGAAIGGIAGWVLGLKIGRAAVAAPGPFRRLRMNALAGGDRIFRRHPVLAVMLTPAWMSGVHHIRSAVYQPLNLLAAALWASGVGLAAYFVGPSVVDFVGDLGLATAILLGVVVVSAAFGALLRRRRMHGRSAARG